MPSNEYIIGAQIGARLGKRHRTLLSVPQQRLTRLIIKQLRRTAPDPVSASGVWNGRPIATYPGTLEIDNRVVFQASDDLTAGELIAEAVAAGIQFPSRQSAQGAQSQSAQSAEGESQSEEGESESAEQSQSESQSEEQSSEQSEAQSEGESEGESESESEEQQENERETGQTQSEEEEQESEQEEEEERPGSGENPNPPRRDENDYRYLRRRWDEIWDLLLEDADGDAQQIADTVGNRPVAAGAAMLNVGLPREAPLHAFALNWEEDARERYEIPTFDPVAWSEAQPDDPRRNGEHWHQAMPYVLKIVEAGIPLLMVGPAGTGKTFMSEQIARVMGLPFGDISFCEGASPAWIFGRQTLSSGFISTDYLDTCQGGGVMNLDEIDAADSNLLLAMNKSLALDPGKGFTNPVNGERVIRSGEGETDPWIPVGCANTYGTGADDQYGGRNKLDAALLNRFRMGRVYIGNDKRLWDHLGIPEGM